MKYLSLLLVIACLFSATQLHAQKKRNDVKEQDKEQLEILHTLVGAEKPNPGLPNVLLIGDSITGHYSGAAAYHLNGIANVYLRKGNGKSTAHTMKLLPQFMGDKKWTVIHFNLGLHDLKLQKQEVKRFQADHENGKLDPKGYKTVNSPKGYIRNLEILITRMREATDAKLVFATTTPVPEVNKKYYRQPAAVVEFNRLAVMLMQKHQIPVNDLHAATLPHIETIFVKPHDVHFSKPGAAFQGRLVAEHIAEQLGARLRPRPKSPFAFPEPVIESHEEVHTTQPGEATEN